MSTTEASNKSQENTEQKITAKWGKTLTKAGFTALPNIIFERQHALGLDSLDLNILLHLAGYWWDPEDLPRPSKITLANAIGVHPRTIQRRIAQLEKGGLIKRIERKAAAGDNHPNEYDLSGLIKEAEPYAVEKLKEIERRRAENQDRLKRKRPVKHVENTEL